MTLLYSLYCATLKDLFDLKVTRSHEVRNGRFLFENVQNEIFENLQNIQKSR